MILFLFSMLCCVNIFIPIDVSTDFYQNLPLKEYIEPNKNFTVKISPINTIEYMHINIKSEKPNINAMFYFKHSIHELRFPGRAVVVGEDGYKFAYPLINTTDFLRWVNEVDCILTNFRDVYVGMHGVVSNGTHLIISGNSTGPDYIYQYFPGRVVTSVKFGICIHHGQNLFGHFICDCLYPLMAIPRNILLQSTIIHFKPAEFKRTFFELIGISSNVIYISENQWVHCDSLISATHPMTHVVHFGPLVLKLNQILREKLNLTKIKPTNVGFIQRSALRIVTNIDECMNATKALVPSLNWQLYDERRDSLIESAKVHAKMKIFGTVPGSNCHKVIFMNPEAIVVFVNTNMWDYSVYLPPLCIGMKLVWFMNAQWGHGYSNSRVDPERFAKAFEVAAYLAVNGTWPDPVPYNAYIDYNI